MHALCQFITTDSVSVFRQKRNHWSHSSRIGVCIRSIFLTFNRDTTNALAAHSPAISLTGSIGYCRLEHVTLLLVYYPEDHIYSNNQIKCSLEAFTAMISKNASTPRAKSFLQQGGREQRSLAFLQQDSWWTKFLQQRREEEMAGLNRPRIIKFS